MNWIDIAGIVFIAVTVNHLGLVSAIENVIRNRLTVVNCPKCLAFWMTVVYCCGRTATHSTDWEAADTTAIMVLAVSFLASYAAIWLELLEGYVDTLYMKLYETIYTTEDDTAATDADAGDTAGSVSDMREARQKTDGSSGNQ